LGRLLVFKLFAVINYIFYLYFSCIITKALPLLLLLLLDCFDFLFYIDIHFLSTVLCFELTSFLSVFWFFIIACSLLAAACLIHAYPVILSRIIAMPASIANVFIQFCLWCEFVTAPKYIAINLGKVN
jgi:hypothetical protein